MAVPVKLKDVIEALEATGQEHSFYLGKRSGEIVLITDSDLEAAENDEPISNVPEWQREMILKAREILSSGDFVELPEQFDIDEYQIMQDFCLELDDRGKGEELGRLIKGGGAFRRFKNAVASLGIRDRWCSFRQQKLEEVAIEWLDAEGIPHERADVIDSEGTQVQAATQEQPVTGSFTSPVS